MHCVPLVSNFSPGCRICRNLLLPYKRIERSVSLTRPVAEKFKILDNEDFDNRVNNSKVPVIVDFFATWCNPCRTLTPRLESIIAENKGRVALAVVDIDENTDLALNYQVAAVPVLLAIKNGKVEQRLVGLQEVEKLREMVYTVLGESPKKPDQPRAPEAKSEIRKKAD